MFYLLYVCPLIMLAHIPDFCRIIEKPFIRNEDYFSKIHSVFIYVNSRYIIQS